MLGVRKGFVDKSSSRGHHSDRYRHFSPERHSYSDNHSRRHRSIDVEERHISVRGYRSYYRRDSPVHGSFPNYTTK